MNNSITENPNTTEATTTSTITSTLATTTFAPTTTTNGDDTDIIVGSVVGSLAGVACLVLIIIFILRRYNKCKCKCRNNGRKKEPPVLPDLRPPIIEPDVPQVNNEFNEPSNARGDSLVLAPRDSLDDLPQIPTVSLKPVTPLIKKAVSDNLINKPPREVSIFPKEAKDDSYVSMNQAPPVHRFGKGYVNIPKVSGNSLVSLQKSAKELSSSNGKHTKVSSSSEGPPEDYIDMKENLPNLTPQKYNQSIKAAEKRAKIKKDNIFDKSTHKNYVNLSRSRQDVSISDNSPEQLVQSESSSSNDSSDEDEPDEYINVETIPNMAQHLNNETSQNIATTPNSANSSPDTNHKASHINDENPPQDYINVDKLVITPPQDAMKPTLKHSNSTSKQENNSPKITPKKAPATLPKPKANSAVDNKESPGEIANHLPSLVKNNASENQHTPIEDEDDGIYENAGEKVSKISEHLKSLNTLKVMPPNTSHGVHTPPQKPNVSPKPTRPMV